MEGSPPTARREASGSPLQDQHDDGLVRAMGAKYVAERASARNTPAALRGSTDPRPAGAGSSFSPTQSTPSGRVRQHNPYRSSDALRALPDEPTVAASAMLPSAAAAAPAGLRARRDAPPPPAPSALTSAGYQVPRVGTAVAAAPPAISDSDSDDGGAPAVGTTDSLTVGGARLSPGAVYRPASQRPNRSPFLGAGPPNNGAGANHSAHSGAAAVRRTPGARAEPDAPAPPPRYVDPAPPRPPQQHDQHFQQQQPQQMASAPAPRTSEARGGGGGGGSDSAPPPFTARDMERLLQAAIAAAPADSGEGNDGPCADVACPGGIGLTVYNGDISQHFSIPSENVQITRGSIKYVDHHTRYGAQTRFRFQLCHNYLLRKCPKLSECSYIHATQLPAPTQVHLNPFAPRRLAADRHGHSDEVAPSVQDDPSVVEQYETLPPGTTLVVHPPNAAAAASKGRGQPAPPQRIASSDILWTVGAKTALDYALAAATGAGAARRAAEGPVPGSRPRHCAHYQFKRLCNLGRDCHFIHSKVPFADVPQPPPPTFTTSSTRNTGGAPVRRTGAKPIPPEAFGPGAVPPPGRGTQMRHDGSLLVSAPQHQHHHQHQQHQQHQSYSPYPSGASQNGGVAGGMPPSPEGISFLAGMQYAMQVLQMQQQQHMQNHGGPMGQGPAPLPVPSPPSVGVSPFTTGVGPGGNASVFANMGGMGGMGGGGMGGPLAQIPPQQGKY